MSRYKWAYPADWLDDKIGATTNVVHLTDLARSLASLLDSDQIQDTFQAEMDDDGYFKDDEDNSKDLAGK